MTSDSTLGSAGAKLRTLAVAAALACTAGSGIAGTASVSITSFSVSSADFSGSFAWAVDAYQSYTMSAQDAGGLSGSAADNFSANDWNLGLNRLAQTPNARATGNTVQFTDAATQLTTGGFNVSALSTPGSYQPPALPNYANASALQSGEFVLLDSDGNRTAGTLSFDIYYDMSVASSTGSFSNYSQTVLNLISSNSGGGGNANFADGLLSGSLANGTGSTSGHFSWTVTLAAGESAYYTLSSSAITAAAVPEPGGYALMGIGLAALGAFTRRRLGTARRAA